MLAKQFRKDRKKPSGTYLVNKKLSKGISNFQIEKALKGIDDTDIDDNFLGVFHANHMNKFIRKYPFIVANTDIPDKNGGQTCSFLTLLGLMS